MSNLILTSPPMRVCTAPVPGVGRFPQDLTEWQPAGVLLRRVAETAKAVSTEFRQRSRVPEAVDRSEADNILILIAYAYLQGRMHSLDVVRCLDSDPELAPLWPFLAIRPEQIRRYRRENRSLLVDCMAGVLRTFDFRSSGAPDTLTDRGDFATPFRQCHPIAGHHLEPYRRAATERIDRAIILDSIALDY